MCLDPRPESLVRTRPASRRRSKAAAVSAQSLHVEPHQDERDRWLAAFSDGLDARGWTLVTRATSC